MDSNTVAHNLAEVAGDLKMTMTAVAPTYYLAHSDKPGWRKLYLVEQLKAGQVEFDPKVGNWDRWEDLLSAEDQAKLNTLPWRYQLTLGTPVFPIAHVKGAGRLKVQLPAGSSYQVVWVMPMPDKQGVYYADIQYVLDVNGAPNTFTTKVALNSSHIYRKYAVLREGVYVERTRAS